MQEKDALYDVISSIWRRKWVAVGVFAAMIVLPVVYVSQLEDEYTAQSKVHIAHMPGLDPGNRSAVQVYNDPISLQTEVEVLKSDPIALAVIDTLDLAAEPEFAPQGVPLSTRVKTLLASVLPIDLGVAEAETPEEMRDRVLKEYYGGLKVSNDGRSALAEIDFTSKDPALSREIANAHAIAYISNRSERRIDPYDATAARLLAPARTPAASKPGSAKMVLGLGVLIALIAGALAALSRDHYLRRDRRLEAVSEELGLGGLAALPVNLAKVMAPKAGRYRTFFDERCRSVARMLHEDHVGEKRVFIVSSALPGEGAAVVAHGLAQGFEALGKPVCLVDADLRGKGLSEQFELEPGAKGVSEWLLGGLQLPETKRKGGLLVLPSGQRRQDAARVMTRDLFERLFTDLAKGFDNVVVLAPPMEPLPDVMLMSPEATSTVLVVRSDARDLQASKRMITKLRDRHAALSGVMLAGNDPEIEDLLSNRATRALVEVTPADSLSARGRRPRGVLLVAPRLAGGEAARTGEPVITQLPNFKRSGHVGAAE